ncbi:hypothetical protein L6452_18499 [Arctium lappa]|uniref:Uncharacterized protein n=1 Tax=Arctium lappa TaxID=4217 RepID=A0ACB9C6N0_ARCLA|nr:hypothetical protein L6452_18499 [Arctium lappa]
MNDTSTSFPKMRAPSLLDTFVEAVEQVVEDTPTASPPPSPQRVNKAPSQQVEGTNPSSLPLAVNLISSFPENPEASVRIRLQESLNVAMDATNEILGITKDAPMSPITMVEVEPPLKPFMAPTPSFDLHRVTKPRTRLGPSLRQNVTLALANLDHLLGLNILSKPTPTPVITPPVDNSSITPTTNIDQPVITIAEPKPSEQEPK